MIQGLNSRWVSFLAIIGRVLAIGLVVILASLLVLVFTEKGLSFLKKDSNKIMELVEKEKEYKAFMQKTFQKEKEMFFLSEVNPDMSIKDAETLLQAIEKYNKTGLTNYDILSICTKESELKKDAKNPDGSGNGICQINPSTYKLYCGKKHFDCEPEKLLEIDYNVKISAYILAEHRKTLEKKYLVTMFSLRGEVDDFTKEQYKIFIDKMLISSYNKGVKNASVNDEYTNKVLEIKERL